MTPKMSIQKMALSNFETDFKQRELSQSPLGLDLFDCLGLCEALMSKEELDDVSMTDALKYAIHAPNEKSGVDEHEN